MNLSVSEKAIPVFNEGEEFICNFKLEEKTNIEMLATNTLFLVKQDGKYGYVNKNGDLIVNTMYDDAKEQNSFGYCAVKKDGKWGVLKSDGTVVLSPSVDLDEYLYIELKYKDMSREMTLNPVGEKYEKIVEELTK